MNIFEKIITGIRELGSTPKKNSDNIYNITDRIQQESDSVLSLSKEINDPTISPSEAALKKVLLAMKIKKRDKK